MHVGAPPASKDAQGVHANTADCDCARCSGDLWLSAVVSPAAPGVAVCPEHADVSASCVLGLGIDWRSASVWLGLRGHVESPKGQLDGWGSER